MIVISKNIMYGRHTYDYDYKPIWKGYTYNMSQVS